jgi:hypothetical protein
MGEDVGGDRQAGLCGDLVFAKQRAQINQSSQSMFEMRFCAVEFLAPSRIIPAIQAASGRSRASSSAARAAILIPFIQRADAVNEALFFGRCHQPLEKTKFQPVALWYGWRWSRSTAPASLSVMDCIKQPGPRQANRRPIAARADRVFRPARSKGQRRRRFRQVQRDTGGKADAPPETKPQLCPP